ncbi:MAG: trifunctional transcriptional activator/DNA repair protein Ada/methylated-DNA--[protein]-cysteine S-methyltransferase [Candidatus Zixiibacteriota bacterium]
MSKLPSPDIMYQALLNRDSAYEVVFYVGVRTTGIFCRPTCAARKPKQGNIEFFPSQQEALFAGYRPCSRCHPMERDKRPPELVKQLADAVDESPVRRIRDAELRARGIDPSTARRQFQRYYGMTFQAYHRARRMGLALRDIRKGESVIGAQIDHGFESASGFYDAFKQLFGMPPSRAKGIRCLYARWIDTPLGAMLALADDAGLHLLEFVDRRGLENEIVRLRKQTGAYIVPGEHRYLDQIGDEVKAYYEGRSLSFSLALVTSGSEFETAVWENLQRIPPGCTWSYAELARKVGRSSAVRAVGRANGQNRLAIVIPCHRVIRSDGSLCGYGGGIWRKQWLLDHEKHVMAQSANQSLTQGASVTGSQGQHANR